MNCLNLMQFLKLSCLFSVNHNTCACVFLVVCKADVGSAYLLVTGRYPGGYGGCNPPKFVISKIFWVNLWQLYYSDSTVFKFLPRDAMLARY